MRKLITCIVVFSYCCISAANAQGIAALLPDSTYLSADEIKAIYYSSKKDTLGFSPLTQNLSLEPYSGKENRQVRRTLQSILRTVGKHAAIYNEIAGKRIASVLNDPSPDATYNLTLAKFRLTKNGVMIVALRVAPRSPARDIPNYWRTLDYYFVDFDQRVSLVNTIRWYHRFYKVAFMPDRLAYRYPNIEPDNTTAEKTPPTFKGGEDELGKYLETHTVYPIRAMEDGIQGRSAIIFTVQPDSTITNIRLFYPLDPFTDKAVINSVETMHNLWIPGKLNGVATPIEVIVSVLFRLDV